MRSRYITERERALLRSTVSGVTGLVLDVLDCTGLRLGDVLALETAQLEEARHAGGWLTVREQKTGKERKVRLPGALLGTLRCYAGERYVFENVRDVTRHRTSRGVELAIKRGCARLGLRKEGFSPHAYRKAYAVRRLRETGDLDVVQRELNHDNPLLTAYYATSDKQRYKRPAKKILR